MSQNYVSKKKEPIIKKRLGHINKTTVTNNKLKETKIVKKKQITFNQQLPSFSAYDITSKYSLHGLLAYINNKYENKRQRNNDNGREI